MVDNYKEIYERIYNDIKCISENEGIYCGHREDDDINCFFFPNANPYYIDEETREKRHSRAYYGISFNGRIDFLKGSELDRGDICLFWRDGYLYKLRRDYRFWHKTPIYGSKIDTKYRIRNVKRIDDLDLYELNIEKKDLPEKFENYVVLMDKDFSVRNTPFSYLRKNEDGTLYFELLYVPKEIKIVGTINKDGLIDSKVTIVSINREPYDNEDRVIDLSTSPNYDPKNIDFDYLKGTIYTVLNNIENRKKKLTRKNREELIQAGFKIEDKDIDLSLPRKPLAVTNLMDNGGIMLEYEGETDEYSQLKELSLKFNYFSADFSQDPGHTLGELFGTEFNEDMVEKCEDHPKRSENWPRRKEMTIKKDDLLVIIRADLDDNENLISVNLSVAGRYLFGDALQPSIVSEKYKLNVEALKGLLNMNLINPKESEQKRRELKRSPKKNDDLPF